MNSHFLFCQQTLWVVKSIAIERTRKLLDVVLAFVLQMVDELFVGVHSSLIFFHLVFILGFFFLLLIGFRFPFVFEFTWLFTLRFNFDIIWHTISWLALMSEFHLGEGQLHQIPVQLLLGLYCHSRILGILFTPFAHSLFQWTMVAKNCWAFRDRTGEYRGNRDACAHATNTYFSDGLFARDNFIGREVDVDWGFWKCSNRFLKFCLVENKLRLH